MLLSKVNCSERVTPVLSSPYWLAVHFQMQSKLLVISFKAISNLRPGYLRACFLPYVAMQRRGAGRLLLMVPSVKYYPEQPVFSQLKAFKSAPFNSPEPKLETLQIKEFLFL